QKEQSKCRQGTGQSTRDKIDCNFLSFSNFPPAPFPYVPASQGMEPRRRQMPASARGHYRGHCRRDIAGWSTRQGKRRTDPGAAPHGIPECSSGLPLVVLK
ncbi:unnamed protein product, partial [Staurois parvus]